MDEIRAAIGGNDNRGTFLGSVDQGVSFERVSIGGNRGILRVRIDQR
jgi:hypothetical protein